MAYRRTKSRTRRPATRRVTSRRAANGGSQWSREEIAFMRKYYRNHETSWCARQLGRTVYSVRYKASDLSIKKANPSVWKTNPSQPIRWSAGSPSPKSRFAAPRRRSNRRPSFRWSTRRMAKRRSR